MPKELPSILNKKKPAFISESGFHLVLNDGRAPCVFSDARRSKLLNLRIVLSKKIDFDYWADAVGLFWLDRLEKIGNRNLDRWADILPPQGKSHIGFNEAGL